MSRTKLKISLISLTNFCAYESWLSDLAGKGLILKKAGRLFSRFAVSEPKEMEYRIQFLGDSISDSLKEKYQSAGWTYVNTVSEFSFFCHDTKGSPAPAEEEIIRSGMNFQYVARNFTLTYASIAVLVFTLFWFLYVNIFSSLFPLLNTASSLLSLVFLLTAAGAFITNSLQHTLEFRKLRQAYLEGRKFNHHMPWKHYQSSVVNTLLLLLLMFLINIAADIYSNSHTYRYYNEQPPVTLAKEASLLHLSDIEDGQQSPDPSEAYETLFFLKKPVVLYTEYILTESHPVETDPKAEREEIKSSFLEEAYLRLNVEFIAKPILKEFVQNTLYNYEQLPGDDAAADLIVLNDPDFDEAYYIYRDHSLDLFLRQGRNILKLRYLGSKGVDDILPLVKEQLIKMK